MASQVELTPCGAMFDIFKRAAHLSHIELCGLVLSSRPLADGRSPQSRAADRSWVSRFIVRAPVGTLQQRYFAEYGTSAARIMSQLALRQRNPMDSTAVINMVCGPAGEPMVRALEECHQDTNLYRNALDRLSQAAELMPAERAEAITQIQVSDQGRFGATRLSATDEGVPALGYVLENAWMGHCLWKALDPAVVEWRCPAEVTRLEALGDGYRLHLNDDTSLDCDLAVLADGGRSGLREQLGIAVRHTPYDQCALIANVTPAEPHGGQAFERFTEQGPLALLPLSDNR